MSTICQLLGVSEPLLSGVRGGATLMTSQGEGAPPKMTQHREQKPERTGTLRVLSRSRHCRASSEGYRQGHREFPSTPCRRSLGDSHHLLPKLTRRGRAEPQAIDSSNTQSISSDIPSTGFFKRRRSDLTNACATAEQTRNLR